MSDNLDITVKKDPEDWATKLSGINYVNMEGGDVNAGMQKQSETLAAKVGLSMNRDKTIVMLAKIKSKQSDTEWD